jgi:hypothetical protein
LPSYFEEGYHPFLPSGEDRAMLSFFGAPTWGRFCIDRHA